MGIERIRIQIGDCPSPGTMKGMTERRTGAALEQRYDSEENRLTVAVYLLGKGRVKPDKVVELWLCPQGQQCACMYQTGLSWEATGACDAEFAWQWPERGGCPYLSTGRPQTAAGGPAGRSSTCDWVGPWKSIWPTSPPPKISLLATYVWS